VRFCPQWRLVTNKAGFVPLDLAIQNQFWEVFTKLTGARLRLSFLCLSLQWWHQMLL